MGRIINGNLLDAPIESTVMKISEAQMAEEFLELASEQRIEIILNLLDKEYTLSNLAKEIEATAPEVHRNVTRLMKNKLIQKNSNGNYSLTVYGKTICAQMPSIFFVYKNKKYFEDHDLGNIPQKYIQRIGALEECKLVEGYVKVLEKWTQVHEEAKKYIYNILSEVPYNKDLIDIIEAKLKNNILIRSIFTENTVIPESRKKLFEEKDFVKYVRKETLQRKIGKNILMSILANEKEACVIFPKKGIPDMSQMFVSSDPLFHEWCIDYFNDCWNDSSSFQESRLKE